MSSELEAEASEDDIKFKLRQLGIVIPRNQTIPML